MFAPNTEGLFAGRNVYADDTRVVQQIALPCAETDSAPGLQLPGVSLRPDFAVYLAPARCYQIRCSIVVSISACHAEDLSSIPGGGDSW